MVGLRPDFALGVVFNVVLFFIMKLLPFISSVLVIMLGGSPVHHKKPPIRGRLFYLLVLGSAINEIDRPSVLPVACA